MEREDVRRWTEWLRPPITGCVDVFGESMDVARRRLALPDHQDKKHYCAGAAQNDCPTEDQDNPIGYVQRHLGLTDLQSRVAAVPLHVLMDSRDDSLS